MPNLGGVFEPGLPTQDARQRNERQIRRLRIDGIAYDEYRHDEPGLSMALLDHGVFANGPQPVTTTDGRHVLMLDGEILNGGELRRRFRSEIPDDVRTDAALCLWLLLHVGDEILASISGQFVIVLFDRKNQQLRLYGDRYGFRPLFYRVIGNGLIFGSELKAIAVVDPAPRQLDETALLELFSFGHQVGTRTWLRGYRKLGPAGMLRFDAQGAVESAYWHYAYDEQAAVLDQNTYVTVYRTLMDRAVDRAMQGPRRIGIFLSGGYDSRVVAGSVRSQYLPLPSVTFGLPESRDVQYAEQLAQRLGFDHRALHDPGPYLANYCRSIAWRNEGMLPFTGGTSIRFHAELAPRMDIFLTGVLGELGGSHTWPRLLAARTRRATIEAVFDWLAGGRQATVRRLFTPAFYTRHFSAMRADFDAGFNAIRNDHPLNVADCWNRIYAHPRNTLHAPATDRYRFEMRAPHMDAELVDFLLTIPPWSRIEQRVYKKLIAYGYPQIRDVPCTNSTRPVDPVFLREYTRMVLRLAGRKIGRPVARAFGRSDGIGREPTDTAAQIRAERSLADDVLRPLLRDGAFPADIFDHAGIEAVLHEHYAGGADHSMAIALLVSWGLASHWLCNDIDADVPAGFFVGT